MAILVDYRCTSCGHRGEHWQQSPPAPSVACGECGAESRRLFAAVGLSGSLSATAPSPAAGDGTQPTGAPAGLRRRSLCSTYPQVPGLCHMSESAGRMWVAKYLKNGRAIDREQERQEKAAAVTAPTMADAISHEHSSHQHATAAPTT